MHNYSSLQETEQEESGVLFHVAEPARARWNHIDDLDSFFSRLYKYHQRHGFLCMVLKETLELTQFVFVIVFTTFLLHGVDYGILFQYKTLSKKVSISDIIKSPSECIADFGLLTYVALVVATIVWILRFLRSIYHLFHYLDIKQFYNNALCIADCELDNMTWHEVQTRVRAVQIEQQMCIHKRELTELDIYHRILRQQNYLVAMTNKRLIPPRLQVPLIGEVVYWSKCLRYNVQLLLFWGPWAPFENPWHLREDYRKPNARQELARMLGNHILWLALGNLIFSPLVLLWQILYAFFTYAELIKREPGSLALRGWSPYGRLYLRHFNELDHELQARLCRAHRPATRYLSSFHSPIGAIIGRTFAFMCGSILAVLIVLTIYDEDVLYVEHMLTAMTGLGAIIAICRALIPDETNSYCPESLLTNVLAHTHYLPSNWKGQAHTCRVRTEFQQVFQYKIVGLLEELISPILTPYVLWRHIYPKSLDIVDFFRNFTVSVVGVGDVCSFAQMDVRRHGNPDWQDDTGEHDVCTGGGGVIERLVNDQYTQAEDGKTELSLMHFTHTNPSWRPPPDALHFIETTERESTANRDALQATGASMFVPASGMYIPTAQSSGDYILQVGLTDSSLRGDAWRAEGPLPTAPNDMSKSTMFLYERHHNKIGRRAQHHSSAAVETTPLLTHVSSQ